MLLRLLLLLSLCQGADSLAGYAIPGTTQTLSGYDTELGRDAMCWQSFGGTEIIDANNKSLAFPNPVVEDFRLNNRVNLLQQCPPGNSLTVDPPQELAAGEVMRTGRWYNYTVHVTINTSTLALGATIPEFISDSGKPMVALQIVVCELGPSGFCSPFIHEEANARLRAENRTEEINRGDRHGGTHVHSAYIFKELPGKDQSYEFTLKIPLLINDEGGDFVAIGAVQMYMQDWFGTGQVRYDMANALIDHPIIRYQVEPEILVIPREVLLFSHVAIGIVGMILTFFLFQTIRHRNHQVLKLTQGHFLIVFLVAALTATLSCFLFNPKNDVYCQSALPMLLCSAQLLYAVTLGRLWRINELLSPLLVKTLRAQEKGNWIRSSVQKMWDSTTSFMSFGEGDINQNRMRKLRKKVEQRHLIFVIALATVPQIAIQVMSVVIQPLHLEIDFNSDESIGRIYCASSDKANSMQIVTYGYICFALLIVILLFTAHSTRMLPSLFNETRDIFDSTLATLVIVVLGSGILAVTNNPTTSPAVEYLLFVGVTLSVTVNTSARIMVPKLRKIWMGEIVLVSKLMSDHKESVMKDDMLYRRRQSESSHMLGGAASSIMDPSAPDYSNYNVSGMEKVSYTSDAEELETAYIQDQVERGIVVPESPMKGSMPVVDFGALMESPNRGSRHNSPIKSMKPKINIAQGKAPPRRMVLKLLNMQNQLKQVNDQIMSGMEVTEDDWGTLRHMSTKLGATFKTEVDFAWERKVDRTSLSGAIQQMSESVHRSELHRQSMKQMEQRPSLGSFRSFPSPGKLSLSPEKASQEFKPEGYPSKVRRQEETVPASQSPSNAAGRPQALRDISLPRLEHEHAPPNRTKFHVGETAGNSEAFDFEGSLKATDSHTLAGLEDSDRGNAPPVQEVKVGHEDQSDEGTLELIDEDLLDEERMEM